MYDQWQLEGGKESREQSSGSTAEPGKVQEGVTDPQQDAVLCIRER